MPSKKRGASIRPRPPPIFISHLPDAKQLESISEIDHSLSLSLSLSLSISDSHTTGIG